MKTCDTDIETIERAATILEGNALDLRVTHNVDYRNPDWKGEDNARILHDQARHHAQRLLELARRMRADPGWKRVIQDGYPPCDFETLYIGANSAGFCGIFNHHVLANDPPGKRSVCSYVTAQVHIEIMTDLAWWRVLDLPYDNQGQRHGG